MWSGTLPIILVLYLTLRVMAQTSGFQWTFGLNFLEEDFTECQILPVRVEPRTNKSSAVGVAPYYILAFEADGIPTTTPVGADISNLTWQVKHKQGSVLMLATIDSNGSTGGVAPRTFSVIAGNDASCLSNTSTNSSSIPSITPNVTTTISTCQPWGLTIEGGQKPYTVVLSALNSPVITNITMGPEDNIFTYINRADPGGQLMASVVDAHGQWGVSSGIVHTSGSNDTTCQGMVSSSLTSSQLTSGTGTNHRNRTSLVVGLLLGLGIPIVMGIAFIIWMLRRRGRVQAEEKHLQHYHMFIPRPWTMFKRADHGGGATQDDEEFNPLVRSAGSPSRSIIPSPGPEDQEKLLDDVSSARSTYNTSPPPSSPSDRKEQQVDAAQSRARAGSQLRSSSTVPQTVPQVSSVPVQEELAPVVRPDTSINNLIRYSEDDVLHPHDLPPPYENISAHQPVVLDDGNA